MPKDKHDHDGNNGNYDNGNDDDLLADIERLQGRHDSLKDKRIRAEERLKTAEEKLKSLRKQAKKEFGTDDLNELKTKLSGMQEENARRTREYTSALDEIERRLAEVEERYEGKTPDGDDE